MERVADVTVWVVDDRPPPPYQAGAKTRFWRDAQGLARFVAHGGLHYPENVAVLRTGPDGTFDLTEDVRAAMRAPAASRVQTLHEVLADGTTP